MRYRQIPKNDVDKMMEMFKNGDDTLKIAMYFGVQPSTVTTKARVLNIKRPEGWKRKLVSSCVRVSSGKSKKNTTKTPRLSDEYRFKPYGNVGIMKSFELDCWHVLRLNEVAGVSTSSNSELD